MKFCDANEICVSLLLTTAWICGLGSINEVALIQFHDITK